MHKLLLALPLVLVGCSGTPEPTPPPEPLNWSLNIDQPIRQLEELLATRGRHAPRGFTTSNIAFLQDIKLFLLFHQQIDALPAAERSVAIEEQRQWLAERKRLTSEAADPYRGGTFASLAANDAYSQATLARLAELEGRLSDPTP